LNNLLICEPVLTYYAFFNKNLPEPGAKSDHHQIFKQFIDDCVSHLKLTEKYSDEINSDPRKIDLIAQSEKVDLFEIIFGAFSDSEKSLNQIVAHTQNDILGLLISLSSNETSLKLETAWNQVFDSFRSSMSAYISYFYSVDGFKNLSEGIWNDTLIFWGLGNDLKKIQSLKEEEIRKILPFELPRSSFNTDLKNGKLWLFDNCSNRKIFIIIVESSANDFVNNLIWNYADAPPPLNNLEAYSGKFRSSSELYYKTRKKIMHRYQMLDRSLKWFQGRIIEENRRIIVDREEYLDELLQRLNSELADYADWKRVISNVRELYNTIDIILTNYNKYHNNVIYSLGVKEFEAFGSDPEQGQSLSKQILGDIAYYDSLSERFETILNVIKTRLEIIDRQQNEKQNRLIQLHTAILASLLAGITILDAFNPTFHLTNDLIIALSIFIFSSFFALPLLIGNFRIKYKFMDIFSGGLMIGSLCVYLFILTVNIYPDFKNSLTQYIPFWLIILVLSVIGSIFGALLLKFINEWLRYQKKSIKSQHKLKNSEIDRLNKHYKNKLLMLLAHLPGSPMIRIKNPELIMNKLEQKAFNIISLEDEIGIRYIESPWKIDYLVSLIKARVIIPETNGVPDINYHNKKDGYKSIHIGVDFLGKGEDSDIDFSAKIQIRTKLQDRFANFSFGRIYKPAKNKKPSIFVRLWANFLLIFSNFEFFLFGRWMGFPKE